MSKVWGSEGGKKGGKVRGKNGTGKSKSGVNRKSGSGGHSGSGRKRLVASFRCKSCGTTKSRDGYADNQWDNRKRGNGPTCKTCKPKLK
jgi:hypothetical protein